MAAPRKFKPASLAQRQLQRLLHTVAEVALGIGVALAKAPVSKKDKPEISRATMIEEILDTVELLNAELEKYGGHGLDIVDSWVSIDNIADRMLEKAESDERTLRLTREEILGFLDFHDPECVVWSTDGLTAGFLTGEKKSCPVPGCQDEVCEVTWPGKVKPQWVCNKSLVPYRDGLRVTPHVR